MSDPRAPKPPAEEENLYRPPGPGPNVFEGFTTLNTQGSRPGIDDRECWWLDGFMPIGRSYIRTLPGVGDPIFVAGHLVPPGPPGPPVPTASTAIYIPGQSCELFRFPLTASGTITIPDINITGTISTLTGPRGNLESNTLAVAVDPGTGNQYVLQQNLQLSNQWITSIPVFASNANGDPAPIHNIVGAATNLSPINSEVTGGGICLDAQKNIYAGIQGSGQFTIVKFAAGSDGNATGTVIVTEAGLNITSLSYDAVNNLIWTSCYAGAPFTSLARSYTPAGVFNTQITSAHQTIPGEVFIGPAGQIVLAGVGSGAQSVVEVFPSGSSGTPAATQTITINPPGAQGPTVSCAAMDAAGLLYVGPIASFSPGFTENIYVYAAGVTGTDPATLRTFNCPLFVQMADSTATNIQQIIIGTSQMSITQGAINTLDPWTGSANHNVAHGLSSGPTILSTFLQCKIAEHGYNIGDIVLPQQCITQLPLGSIWSVSADGGNTYITTNSFGETPELTSRDTNAFFKITPANWKVVCIPYLVA